MKVGDKFVKDGEVVEVVAIVSSLGVEIVWYAKSRGEVEHCLTKDDFLKQYKPYAPVYEYRYAFINREDNYVHIDENFYLNEYDFFMVFKKGVVECLRLDFTKRERVQ